MNVGVLIDNIVRQTTVLIAELATAAGIRAPLAHVANEVFLDLVRELEAQGVGRKVIADMFGIALRSYQVKVQRLSESQTHRDHSLWEAVLERLRSLGTVSRAELLSHFSRDDPATLTPLRIYPKALRRIGRQVRLLRLNHGAEAECHWECDANCLDHLADPLKVSTTC